ncbi:MAG TPA: porin [Allosphingosinicella sp.]
MPAPRNAVGSFTPAVRDPRLAAELARRGNATALRFTPATTAPERNRAVRVAVRVRQGVALAERPRPAVPGASATIETPSGTAITPSTYNLGVAVGWRRFAITGDLSNSSGGAAAGTRETTRVGVDYRANRRLTGRVQLGTERAEGVQRIVGEDRAYSLDVGGSYSIGRNVDVTGGVRYRVSRDRLEPLANDERRDSQAVYIGTAVRF